MSSSRRDGKPVLFDRTATVLRALEIEAEGAPQGYECRRRLYADPKQDPRRSSPGAVVRDALVNGYAVMDANASASARRTSFHRRVQHQPARRDGRVLAGERVAPSSMNPPTTTLADHVKQAKHSMDKAVEAVKREFSTVRTGKATTSRWTWSAWKPTATRCAQPGRERGGARAEAS